MPILEVTGLSKSFKGTQAVKGISFLLREGRCATLLGPNGAGKSTTLRMLAGLLTPTAGNIQMEGDPSNGDMRSMIGYLPQYPAFYAWMTGREYLTYVGQLSRMTRAQSTMQADKLLLLVGLADAARTKIGAYSGGMKQRLGLAQAMMHRPRLIILDEPVSSLDPLGRRDVLDMMKQLKRETTILFSTHVLPDAEEITDDIMIMNAGEIVVAGELQDVMERHRQPVIRLKGEDSLEEWQAAFAGLAGVESAVCRGDQAELQVADRDLSRSELMRFLVDRHIAIRKLEVSELSLEALFMKAVKAE